MSEITHEFAEEYMLVERFLLNELNEVEREHFERHMFNCNICFERVRVGEDFTANISPPDGPSGSRWILPLLLVFVVACPSVFVFSGHPQAVPLLVVGGAVLAMLISVLFRYNEHFREFWTRHVCAFMEKHAVHRDETKGGR